LTLASPPDQEQLILAGEITAAHGIRGWLKVFSHTSPRENILQYNPWWVKKQGDWHRVSVNGRRQGKLVLAKINSLDDRNQAEDWVGAELFIERSQLPRLDANEYYWADLIGLKVISSAGNELGEVKELLETGANDVMVVGEQLIPFVPETIVHEVDLINRQIVVHWEADY